MSFKFWGKKVPEDSPVEGPMIRRPQIAFDEPPQASLAAGAASGSESPANREETEFGFSSSSPLPEEEIRAESSALQEVPTQPEMPASPAVPTLDEKATASNEHPTCPEPEAMPEEPTFASTQSLKQNTIRIRPEDLLQEEAKFEEGESQEEENSKETFRSDSEPISLDPQLTAPLLVAEDSIPTLSEDPSTASPLVQPVLSQPSVQKPPAQGILNESFHQKLGGIASNSSTGHQHMNRAPWETHSIKHSIHAEKEENTSRIRRIFKRIYHWVNILCFILFLAFLFKLFVAERAVVGGDSMMPTLMQEDQVVVLKSFFYSLDRGDVVTLSSEHLTTAVQVGDLLQRVIAVGGDTVEIRDHAVYVNGEKLEESYLPEHTQTEPVDLRYARVTLSPEQCYVLGDNRAKSVDSRFFGPILREDIIGEVWFRFSNSRP